MKKNIHEEKNIIVKIEFDRIMNQNEFNKIVNQNE